MLIADIPLLFQGGHMYCMDCIKRASDVAIGEGKTQLQCLGQCDHNFNLATLEKALKPHAYAKWTKNIQVGELEKAKIEGLEQCPFCPFAAIMYSTPEENKVIKLIFDVLVWPKLCLFCFRSSPVRTRTAARKAAACATS